VSEERKKRCETCRFRETTLILGTDDKWPPNDEIQMQHPEEQRFTEREYEEEKDDTSGECRRFPPVYRENFSEAIFPGVFLNYWCGEWQEKPASSGQ
jgi:hypothetical protein